MNQMKDKSTSPVILLKTMHRMEEILSYVLSGIERGEELSAKTTAQAFDYNTRYFERIFADYFEIPYHQFVKKLKLRDAAAMLLEKHTVKDNWAFYGYTGKTAFSGAFRKEFGLSPREFIKTYRSVPHMPERRYLFDRPLAINWVSVPDMLLGGSYTEVHDWDGTEVLENMAYSLSHPDKGFYTEKGHTWYGFINYDYSDPDNLIPYYIHVDELMVRRETEISREEKGEFFLFNRTTKKELLLKEGPLPDTFKDNKGRIFFSLPADEYAVFSLPRGKDERENVLYLRLLLHFIYDEWKHINKVRTNQMGWTFSKFDSSYIYVYVPCIKNFLFNEDGSLEELGVHKWIEYIDLHLKEDLTVARLAEQFYYSQKSFQEIFQMYYDMSPSDYIRRKRLYMAACELSKFPQESSGMTLAKVASRYRFSDENSFKKQFFEEFGDSPENILRIVFSPVNLTRYYEDSRQQYRIEFLMEEELSCLVRPIRTVTERGDVLDIPEYAAYWFLKGIEGSLSKANSYDDLISFWQMRVGYALDESFYDYVLGPVLKEISQITDIPEEFIKVTVPEGRYAVFTTPADSDELNLKDTFRMLLRCAFYGWIKENMYRYDGSRDTFVRYRDKKLMFYVPVVF